MLIEGFYTISNLISSESEIIASITLYPGHEVYKGHFPGQPVVPGVIQLQIIKELLEEVLVTKLFMKKVKQVKYLIPVTPNENPELNFTFKNLITDDNNIKTTVSIGYNENIFTKAIIEFSTI